MKRLAGISVLAIAVLISMGIAACPKAQKARDVIATSNGIIVSAQGQWQKSCSANPGQTVCRLINRLIDGQNTAVDALETYCGWTARPTPAQIGSAGTTPCVENPSLFTVLNNAVTNLNQIISEWKALNATPPVN